MATYHYPVLTWKDASGATTATLVGNTEPATAHAATAPEAVRQLRELLEWRFEHEPWDVDPDFLEPVLFDTRVEVRPQYNVGRRILPCPETVWLRVPCVTGRQGNGMQLCTVPHLALSFNYQETAALKGLVAHYVKEALQGMSPAQLAGRLPPRECQLEEIVLRDASQRVRHPPPAERPELKVLFAVADPVLHTAGRARAASAAYGRDTLSCALVRKLGTEKANVLLVGEGGVGKSTVLFDAVKRLARATPASGTGQQEEGAEKSLRSYRFWRGSGGRLIAGMRYLGQWEERCEEFLNQLTALEGVFCAESLLELVQVGGQGAGDSVAAFLLPYLQRGELRMVAEATPTEVEACRRLLPGLLDVFQIVPVPELNDGAALDVLKKVALAFAAVDKLEFEPTVVALVHRLFKRFRPYAAFPGPAANFIRLLCERRSGAQGRTISIPEVITLFVKQTGLPELLLRDELLLPLEEVRGRLAAQIIGQPGPVTTTGRLVTTLKAGLNDPGRPLGVLLFCGPTGVGKTALARALAEFCFGGNGQKDRLIRLDMSEYVGWGAVQRLLWGAQGRPAAWIEQVRRQPFCVLLLDEIEKAGPEVFDVLLGLLDEGRLTDRFGRVTWFRSAFIIMTSNLGATASGEAGFSPSPGPAYESEVVKFFRPEFFNRLDGVVTFTALGPEEVERITRKELADLGTREGLISAGIKLQWSERLVALVAREGYDHRLGARPLQRAIERLVAAPIARWKVAHPMAHDMVLNLVVDDKGRISVTAVTP